ncbi:uncharacterized protein LOC134780119 [Penaeus indicus]|uniref:uncharacterized protein LOC134780119 n=1 Tax=Penaeus indicus TaxID=29960 RepID=UPI00300D3DC2
MPPVSHHEFHSRCLRGNRPRHIFLPVITRNDVKEDLKVSCSWRRRPKTRTTRPEGMRGRRVFALMPRFLIQGLSMGDGCKEAASQHAHRSLYRHLHRRRVCGVHLDFDWSNLTGIYYAFIPLATTG